VDTPAGTTHRVQVGGFDLTFCSGHGEGVGRRLQMAFGNPQEKKESFPPPRDWVATSG